MQPVAPSDAEKEPASHSRQTDDCGAFWYVPLTHGAQPEEFFADATEPAAQTAQLNAPSEFEAVPKSHGRQFDWPVSPWKKPDAHSVQTVLPGTSANRPAWQAAHWLA